MTDAGAPSDLLPSACRRHDAVSLTPGGAHCHAAQRRLLPSSLPFVAQHAVLLGLLGGRRRALSQQAADCRGHFIRDR